MIFSLVAQWAELVTRYEPLQAGLLLKNSSFFKPINFNKSQLLSTIIFSGGCAKPYKVLRLHP